MARSLLSVIRTQQAKGLDKPSDVAKLLDLVGQLASRKCTYCSGFPDLKIGSSNAAKIKIGQATLYFVIGGKIVAFASAEIAVPAGAAMAGTAGAKEVYVMLTSVDGVNVVAAAGDVATGGAAAVRPEVPLDTALIGYVKIAAATATVFTPGTTHLDASGITATYENTLFDEREFPILAPVQ